MPDEIDMAQEADAMHRQSAISAALARAARVGPDPDMINGVPHCVECGDAIPAARMAAVPWACRCAPCQEAVDLCEN